MASCIPGGKRVLTVTRRRDRLAKMLARWVVLGTLLCSGYPVTRTRLMKLLFLIAEESQIHQKGLFYEFLPYLYGPYSFTADRDVRKLVESGHIWGIVSPSQSNARKRLRRSLRCFPWTCKPTYLEWLESTGHSMMLRCLTVFYARYPQHTVLRGRFECLVALDSTERPPLSESSGCHPLGSDGQISADGRERCSPPDLPAQPHAGRWSKA
jgi:hypothetical protein